MDIVPALLPLTAPVDGFMEADPVRGVRLHVPPATPSVRVTTPFEQTNPLEGPLIAVGGSLSVTVVVTWQPVLSS